MSCDRSLRMVVVAVMGCFFWLTSFPVQAQMPGMLPATEEAAEPAISEPSPNDVRELSRLLTDPDIVAWLQSRAENTEEIQENQVSLQELIKANSGRIADRVQLVSEALTVLPSTPGVVAESWNKKFSANEQLALVNLMLIFLFTGIGMEWLYWRYAIRLKRWAEVRHTAPAYGTRSLGISVRLVLVSAGVILFMAGLLGSYGMLEWGPEISELVLESLLFLFGLRIAIAVALTVYSPNDDNLRLVPVKRRSARLIAAGLMTVALLLLGGDWIGETSNELDAAPSAALGIQIICGALAALVLSGVFWIVHFRTVAELKNRSVVIAGAVSGICAAVFVFWLIGMPRVAATILAVGVLMHIATLVRYGLQRSFAQAEAATVPAPIRDENEDPPPEEDVLEQQSRENMMGIYQPVAERLARFAIICTGLLIVALIWGIEPWRISETSSVFGKATIIMIDVLVAWLIGDLIWTATRTAIDRKMATMPKLTHGQAPGPEARMATLLPLFKKVVLVTVIAMIALITLSSLGINIAPILAGAGVVGLAIGFGAQALVRDIVSGVFFLIDDAFRVGEYIEMGELRGTVESISIRSLRVRHHRGAVHTIPFGELKSLTNYSRDWVMMKLEFRVPFETDLKLAKKIVKRIDAELQANPDYGDSFLEPLKFQGVRRMEEFNMVVGVKFMTKPGEQWTIRRDAYMRIRDEFEKNGIHFAQRNVKVEVIGNEPLTDEVKDAAVGAAQDAIEQQAAAPAR